MADRTIKQESCRLKHGDCLAMHTIVKGRKRGTITPN